MCSMWEQMKNFFRVQPWGPRPARPPGSATGYERSITASLLPVPVTICWAFKCLVTRTACSETAQTVQPTVKR
jgi:hypothetical protein